MSGPGCCESCLDHINRSNGAWSVGDRCGCCWRLLADTYVWIILQIFRILKHSLTTFCKYHYSLLKTHFLAWYCDLVEIESLTMGSLLYDLSLPVMNCAVWSMKPQNWECTSLSNGSGIYVTGPELALKEQWAPQRSGPDAFWSSLHCPALSLPAFVASWGVSYNRLTEEAETWAWFADSAG